MSFKEEFKELKKNFPTGALVKCFAGMITPEQLLAEIEKSGSMNMIDKKISGFLPLVPLKEGETDAALMIFVEEGVSMLALMTYKQEGSNTVVSRNVAQVPVTQLLSFIGKMSNPEELKKLMPPAEVKAEEIPAGTFDGPAVSQGTTEEITHEKAEETTSLNEENHEDKAN